MDSYYELTTSVASSSSGADTGFVKGGANSTIERCRMQRIEVCSADISPCKARKKFFNFIFQLSGWALVALSCFALQVLDVRVATRVPGSMLQRDSARSVGKYFHRHFSAI